jgi:hypothetical protein
MQLNHSNLPQHFDTTYFVSIKPVRRAVDEVSQSDIFVSRRDEEGFFRVIFFDIMSHLSDTSGGFVGQIICRKLLHCKAGEHLSPLIRVGD